MDFLHSNNGQNEGDIESEENVRPKSVPNHELHYKTKRSKHISKWNSVVN